MAPDRSSSCTSNNIRSSNLIPLSLNNPYNARTGTTAPHHISMMTRHHPRRHFPRTPHPACTKRPTIWYNSIYYFRSILLLRLFLGFLPFQPCPYSRTWRMLTSHWHYNPRSIRGTPPKHRSTLSIRCDSNMIPSQPHRRRT